eukprot:5852920-Heterocapsa_arctica.AAC.1
MGLLQVGIGRCDAELGFVEAVLRVGDALDQLRDLGDRRAALLLALARELLRAEELQGGVAAALSL